MAALSSIFVEKARVELGEDDEKREECLKQFRVWLKNHEFIKNCRNGEFKKIKFKLKKFVKKCLF